MLDLRKADESYVPFPTFKKWVSHNFDSTKWDYNLNKLHELQSADKSILQKALKIVSRIAAIETGAIEKLYDVDRGFTFSVATESAFFEAALDDKGKDTRALIEGQISTYEYILDLATKNAPLKSAWIRDLHKKICSGQKTYKVETKSGPQNHKLPLGKFKTLPNHVITGDDKIHSYAPVDLTQSEMLRLTDEFESEEFVTAHPIFQASYSHYALVVIHPFSDGNGRVARALASVFTYRAESIPFLLLSQDREKYFSALESADVGNYKTFIDFTLINCISSIELIVQSIKTALTTDKEESLQLLKELYKTSGGYKHEDIDTAGDNLFKIFEGKVGKQLRQLKENDYISVANQSTGHGGYGLPSGQYRLMLNGTGRSLQYNIRSQPPAGNQVTGGAFHLLLPTNPKKNDNVIIHNTTNQQVFEAQIDDILPNISNKLDMRIDMFIEEIINRSIKELTNKARDLLKPK